eukprot:CAMPEP_0119308106 /NCGR_PEP_ID=MMETSP1333-20130426/8407_1 /TAXON_ID=418940 /ORGANISM="Scyphosphaera apsteinii, Strain RCC1455" /LENGTH=291 /DNA_ID=CAMNT_0007311801 /DNA_START=166 /DNA_END=1044 /DNA_ORIENTATION=-
MQLVVVDLEPRFCAEAAAMGLPVTQGRLEHADADAIVHAGNAYGHLVSGLDHALLEAFGPPYLMQINANVGCHSVTAATILPTGLPRPRWAIYVRVFPWYAGVAHQALSAAMKAASAHNERVLGSADVIQVLATPALGTYEGCQHISECAALMAAAVSAEIGSSAPLAATYGSKGKAHSDGSSNSANAICGTTNIAPVAAAAGGFRPAAKAYSAAMNTESAIPYEPEPLTLVAAPVADIAKAAALDGGLDDKLLMLKTDCPSPAPARPVSSSSSANANLSRTSTENRCNYM